MLLTQVGIPNERNGPARANAGGGAFDQFPSRRVVLLAAAMGEGAKSPPRPLQRMSARTMVRPLSAGPWPERRIGASPSGKAADFDSAIRRFESSRPSQLSLPAHCLPLCQGKVEMSPSLAK